MRVALKVGVVALLAIAGLGIARASTVLRFSNEELTRRSDVVFHGRCTSAVAKAGEGAIIVTEYEFEVTRFLKGSTGERTFRFRGLGGTLDGRTWQISGSPNYALDEEVVLFLDAAHPKTGCRHAIGLAQGKWSVREEPDSKKKYVVRDLGGLRLADADGNVKEGGLEGEQESRLYLEPFLATIDSFVAAKK